MSHSSPLQLFCTIDSEPNARELAHGLVDARLAACVQVVGPIHSTYRWRDAVESAQEWLLLIKTTEDRLEAVKDSIVSAHPYEVPEIVAVRIEGGLPGYLDWIAASTM